MNKVKDFNFGYLVDATAFLAAILIFSAMISGNKIILLFGALFGIFFNVFYILYLSCQNTKITNESESKAFIKSKQRDKIDELLPKSTKYGIDGVKINGVVYKISDGTHATITKKGKLRVLSITGNIFYKILRGGIMTTPTDDWKPLFDAK